MYIKFTRYKIIISLNPARTLGPAIVEGKISGDIWIYFIGPIIGSLLAASFHTYFKKNFVGWFYWLLMLKKVLIYILYTFFRMLYILIGMIGMILIGILILIGKILVRIKWSLRIKGCLKYFKTFFFYT